MRDWSTVASLLTALGTLVLALATFVAVRAANRAARVAEYSMQIGIRPLLMPSRLDDTMQKIMWGDEHWARLLGGGATVEEVDGSIYLAMSLRNSGSGIAVIHGWHLMLEDLHEDPPHAEPEEFRPQLRDLYVPATTSGSGRRRSATPPIPNTRACSRRSAHLACSAWRCCTPTTRAGSARSAGSHSHPVARAGGSAQSSSTGTWIGPTPGITEPI